MSKQITSITGREVSIRRIEGSDLFELRAMPAVVILDRQNVDRLVQRIRDVQKWTGHPNLDEDETRVEAMGNILRQSPGMTVDAVAEHLAAVLPATLEELQAEVREVNELNGWFDTERPFSADVALLHSEVSEMYEGYRKGDLVNVREELADVFIRVLDTAERYGVNLRAETERKLAKNRERGYKHGGKVE